jgi:hypothetical protein
VVFLAYNRRDLRAVTHLDVSDEDIEVATQVFEGVTGG